MTMIRLATTRQDFDSVYALRYRAYRSVDAIPKNTDREFRDAHDEQPNSFVFTLEKDGGLVGSLRLLVSSCGGRDLLASQVFPTEINTSFAANAVLVEANRFVMCPESDAGVENAMRLTIFQGFVIICRLFQADAYVGCARRNHVPFYRRVVFMQPISDFKNYPGLQSKMQLLSGNFSENYDRVCDKWGDKLRVDDDELDYWRNEIKSCDLYRDVVFP